MNIVKTWQSGINGTGITICINDPSGVDFKHPEFNGRFVSSFYCYARYFILNMRPKLFADTLIFTIRSASKCLSGQGSCCPSILKTNLILISLHNNCLCLYALHPTITSKILLIPLLSIMNFIHKFP